MLRYKMHFQSFSILFICHFTIFHYFVGRKLPEKRFKCFNMCLLRYSLTKKACAYGKTVYRHLDLIKSKLQGDDPKARQGWLRLLKEICDFVAVTRKREAAKDTKKQ